MYKKNMVSTTIVFLLLFISTFGCVAFSAGTSDTYTQDNKAILEKLEVDGKPAEVLPEGLIPPEDGKKLRI